MGLIRMWKSARKSGWGPAWARHFISLLFLASLLRAWHKMARSSSEFPEEPQRWLWEALSRRALRTTDRHRVRHGLVTPAPGSGLAHSNARWAMLTRLSFLGEPFHWARLVILSFSALFQRIRIINGWLGLRSLLANIVKRATIYAEDLHQGQSRFLGVAEDSIVGSNTESFLCSEASYPNSGSPGDPRGWEGRKTRSRGWAS